MSHERKSSSADRNLLFGILAIQVNFLDRDQLISGMNAWVLEKHKPLSELLIERGALKFDQAAVIELLIEQHLKLHGNDPSLSLRATKALPSIIQDIEDHDLAASIAKLTPIAANEETTSFRPSPDTGTRYRKLRHHADGGQGRVFVADDFELHREVALKEVKPGLSSDPDSHSRFVLEAEITGGLEHPGIVPVYGLGTYPDGRPYYAMKFIRGESLDVAIKQFHASGVPVLEGVERSMAFRHLLRRFVDVCNAVAYAHSRGVVHRDLKPKNIMLGKFGETLVVDWGLAKVGNKEHTSKDFLGANLEMERTLRPASGSSVATTMDGAQIGTPAFMSPEQAAGRVLDLGSASDIYSLGSTLFLLLTGKLPYFAESPEETMEKVRRGDFTPPRKLRTDIPAALDAICRKAMSRQPGDRYASALALAADIDHWLADEPVDAFPERLIAKTARWARRHRLAVAIAGIFLTWSTIGMTVFAISISAEQRKTQEQKRIALDNYAIARDQSFNLIKLIESSEPEFARVPSLHERRAELLTSASTACRHFIEEHPDDIELTRRSANIYRFAANFQRLVFAYEAATPLYRDSIGLRRRLANGTASAEERFQLSEVLRDYASSQKEEGRLKAAKELLDEAVDIVEALLKIDPDRPAYRRGMGLLLLNREILDNRIRSSAPSALSAKQTQRSIGILRKLLNGPLEQRHPYDPLLLASALNQRALIERKAHDFDAARKTHSESIKLLADLLSAKPKGVNDADVVFFRSECEIEQCQTWAKIGGENYLSSAEANAGLAINKLVELARDYPALPMYRESLANAFRVRAELRLQRGNNLGAEEHLKTARELLVGLVRSYAVVPRLRGEMGKTLMTLGIAARRSGQRDAEKLFVEAAVELNEAARISPDDNDLRQSLEELKRAKASFAEDQKPAGSET